MDASSSVGTDRAGKRPTIDSFDPTDIDRLAGATGIPVDDFTSGSGGTSAGSGGTAGGTTEPKRRGRKPGSTNKPKSDTPQSRSIDLKGLESILVSMHAMLAVASQTPELMLADQEGKALAESIRNVLAYYPQSVIDPKTIAWVNLAIVAGGIYGTRFVAVRARKKKQNAPQQQSKNNGPVVVPMQPPVPWNGKGLPPGL